MWDETDKSKNQQSHDVWDFQRENNEQNFTFTRRVPSQPYRLIGKAPDEGRYYMALPPAQIRPNRYNAGVKMVLDFDGPDPWDAMPESNGLRLPIVGEVAAGQHDVTIAYHEPTSGVDAASVTVDTSQIKITAETFALRVRGQSMIDNEIDDGDVIIVQSQDWADDGDFVIACLTDSSDVSGFVTLKRFYRNRQSDRVVLQPANKNLSPIHILPRKGDYRDDDLDGVKIQGRVVAVIKKGIANN